MAAHNAPNINERGSIPSCRLIPTAMAVAVAATAKVTEAQLPFRAVVHLVSVSWSIGAKTGLLLSIWCPDQLPVRIAFIFKDSDIF